MILGVKMIIKETFVLIRKFVKSSTAVLAGNDTFLTENITEDKKKFITQSKHMIF